MKVKKKPARTKHTTHKERKGLAIKVSTIIALVIIAGFVINSLLNQPSSQTDDSTSEPKAAIVDHLSLTYPNQTFIQTATNTLKQARYTVDYCLGENVTVGFYRNLPAHGYKLVILRVHSGLYEGMKPPTGLFTSEPYSKTKYVYEQLADQVMMALSTSDNQAYFTVTSAFIKSSTLGKFENTIIIMMGCDGLAFTDMAEAFIEKGAKAYVSWNGSVSASHADLATTHLLQHFLIEKLTLRKSVQETFKEVGADPAYNSLLIYYPFEAGDYVIQNIGTQAIVGTIAEVKHKEFSGTYYREIS